MLVKRAIKIVYSLEEKYISEKYNFCFKYSLFKAGSKIGAQNISYGGKSCREASIGTAV
jgi:hypothetical protein